MNEVIDRYLDVWNEQDQDARLKAIADLCAQDVTYTDPLGAVVGHEGLDQFVAGAQQQFQGMRFERGETFDAHHNIVRFTWNLVSPGNTEPVVIGFDVAAVDEDNKVTTVYGFIDKMPAA